MPAAAVIPAPIAYINVVVFKKLVVGKGLQSQSRLRQRPDVAGEEYKSDDLKRPSELCSVLL